MIQPKLLLACFVALLTMSVGSAPTQAGIVFSNVIDSTMAAPGHANFTAFTAGEPSLSGDTVAYIGAYTGGSGIYTAAVGVGGATKVVETGDTVPGHTFTSLNGPTISGNKLVFRGGYTGGTGLYTGTVGATGATKVVEVGDVVPGQGALSSFGTNPSLSGNNIGFYGSISGVTGIFSGTVGAVGATQVMELGDTAPGHGPFTSLTMTSVTSGNQIAIFAGYTGGNGIYAGTVGTSGVTKIADDTDTAPGRGTFIAFNGAPVVSGNMFAFGGNYSGGNALYTKTIGAAAPTEIVATGDVAPDHGVFTSFGALSASGNNLAFVGMYSGGRGIYLASAGSFAPVINIGDTLFGSTITSFALGTKGYDDDQIAFSYILANGVRGVAVATVPEPASLVMAAMGVIALAAVARRRRPA